MQCFSEMPHLFSATLEGKNFSLPDRAHGQVRRAISVFNGLLTRCRLAASKATGCVPKDHSLSWARSRIESPMCFPIPYTFCALFCTADSHSHVFSGNCCAILVLFEHGVAQNPMDDHHFLSHMGPFFEKHRHTSCCPTCT